MGDYKVVGSGVLEMRVDFGPGYRLYFVKQNDTLIVMLAGGDKSTQKQDIAKGNLDLQKLELTMDDLVPFNLVPFNIAEHLQDDASIAEYLTAALEIGDLDFFLTALGDVAKAKGMTSVAKRAGLGRESLYKGLAQGATPKFDTVMRVTNALGLRFQAVPIVKPSDKKSAVVPTVGAQARSAPRKRHQAPATSNHSRT